MIYYGRLKELVCDLTYKYIVNLHLNRNFDTNHDK